MPAEQRPRPPHVPQPDDRYDHQQRGYPQPDPQQQDYPQQNYQQHDYQERGYQQPDHPRQNHQPQAHQPQPRQPQAHQPQTHQPRDRQPSDYRQPPRAQQGGEAFLAVHGVEKSFGGRKVVKGVNLYVRRGEAVGLLGPNGAGKTTVFYMITGLIKADRGRIDLDGYNISALPMYQRARLGIGYLPQEASIFRGLTVEDNIRSVLEIVEPNRRKREAELNNLLEEFHITRLRKTPSIALSGGERRRVEIARALASRPNYMLLDEPFAGIDPIAVGDIQALVRHLTSRGIGVLITDHNVRETLGPDRPRLHHLFRAGADGGPHRGHRQRSGGAPALSGRGIPSLDPRNYPAPYPLLWSVKSVGKNWYTRGHLNRISKNRTSFARDPWRSVKNSKFVKARRS